MNARLADAYRRERVFLTGDAARCHRRPATGPQHRRPRTPTTSAELAAVLDGARNRCCRPTRRSVGRIAEAVLGLSERLLEAAKNQSTTGAAR